MAVFLLLDICTLVTAPALSYYRPFMDICIVLVRPPRMVEVQILYRYIHVTMQNLYFLRSCRSLYGLMMMDMTGSCHLLLQLLFRPAASACLDNFFFVNATASYLKVKYDSKRFKQEVRK